jgi:hypothetical protein
LIELVEDINLFCIFDTKRKRFVGQHYNAKTRGVFYTATGFSCALKSPDKKITKSQMKYVRRYGDKKSNEFFGSKVLKVVKVLDRKLTIKILENKNAR